MKHYLLNHQPQKGLQAACAQQGQAPTYNARGKGRTPASPKTLTRILLVLLTMLLLPSAAWGEETTYTFNRTTLSAPTGTATSNITNGGSYSWDIKNFYRTPFGQNISYTGGSVTPTNTTLGFTVSSSETITTSFDLVSSEGMTGTFVSATINYTLSNISAAKVQVLKEDNNSYAPLSYGTGTNEYTALNVAGSSATLEMSNMQAHAGNEILNDNKICFRFSFDSNNSNASITINSITITTTETSYLTVAGIPVTSANANDILGDGKVSFTAAEGANHAKLTLNNATLTVSTDGGAAIESSLDNLIVYLVGNNTVQAGSQSITSFYAFKGNGSNTITFQTNVQEPGKIQGSVIQGSVSEPSVFKDVALAYQKELGLTRNGGNFEIGVIEYGLSIGETAVTSLNASDVFDDGTVSFTPATVGADQESIPATLTLNGASIGQIKMTAAGNLTVYFVGGNTITVDGGVYAIEGGGSGTLAFSTDDDNQGVLTFNGINSENYIARQWETEPSITFTSTSGAESDWYIVNEFQTKIYHVTKNNKYDLWLDGMRYCDANLEPASGTAFDPGTSTLTYQYNGEYHIYSGLSSLTVKTGGARLEAITFGAPSGETISNENGGNLKIVKYSDSDVEQAFTLVGNGTNPVPVISGFTAVDYDDFVVISEGAKYDTDKKQLVDAEGQVMTSAVFVSNLNIAKPTFGSTSSEGVTWVSLQNNNSYPPEGSQSIPFGTIKYSIEYADGSEGVTDEIFTEAFTISKPATVTACVTLNGKESANAIGKYFGASKKEYTVANGDKIMGTSWFIPEIVTGEGGDNISCEFNIQENDNSGIFEREVTGSDSYLVAKKSGTTTVNASLRSGSITSESITVLNSDLIALKFTVGEELSSVFEGNNNYGGLYNDSDTPYAVPEGMTAYLVTGISEDGTSVSTQSIDYLPARTAVLLQRGEGAKAITKIPYEGSATVPTNNKFYYSDSNNPATAPTTRSWYVIYNNKFTKVTGGTEIKGGKCYLDLGTTAGTRGFYNIGGGEGSTSIREVISEGVNSEKLADGEWYTLQGQRVAKPAKGLYILNGKKVVIK